MTINNNITGVKISEFNVSQSIPDSALIPFVSLDTNLTIKYSDLKTALGISGSIKTEGGPNSVSILNQPSSSISYIRGVRGDRGVTALLAPTSEVLIRGNFANDDTGAGLIKDPTANQIVFRSIVGGENTTVTQGDDTVTIDVNIPVTISGGTIDITGEVETEIAAINTYYPLAGTFALLNANGFDVINGNQLRKTAGENRLQLVIFDAVVSGTAGNNLRARLVKFTAATGVTSEVISQIRQVNNVFGPDDNCQFNMVTNTQLAVGDYVFAEIRNESGTDNVTAKLDTFITVGN